MKAVFATPLLWLLPCILLSGHAAAQQQPEQQEAEHQPLAVSATLGFADILASTLQNAPEARGIPVREQQADDFSAMGRSWLAGRPSVVGNYLNDRTLDNQGMLEMEYGVQLPLWRPGEKSDTAQLGSDYQQQSTRWQQSLRLTLAGRVRTLLADISEAEQLLTLESEATADAVQITAVTTRLFEAGAVARLDVLQSENLLLQQQQRQLQAEAALQDAEIVYRLTTGLDVKPATALMEVQTTTSEISASHPLLQYLQSDVDVAAGSVRQSEIAALGNPQLTIGTRRQRGDRFQPTIDSLSIGVSVPFGGRSFVSSRTSAARLQQVEAETQYHSTHRQLQLALHEAEHELSVTRTALPLAERQASLAAERRELAQRAFAAGELTLVQVLSAVQEARSSARELVLRQQQERRLIAEYNQVLGVVP